MTSRELREKYDKARETVAKKYKTVERHEAQAEKKLQIVIKNGWEKGLEDDSCFRGENYCYDALDAIYEYKNKLDDINGAKEKLEDAKRIADNWGDKLQKQIKKEKLLATKVPDAFKEAREELVKSWTESDLREKARIAKAVKELEYKEYSKMYPYSVREYYLYHDEDFFRKANEHEADEWLLDLYNRVVAITGEITDAKHIRWGGKCLDGYVVGKEGRANVTTIDAGGYNIQRWHLRTLVKDMK